ncbi:unnamed protein product [Prunus armeniaca]|uniref:OTU domain-containing protein n=1 Tax=Prunus armeniaca TaxID=36596 RepID=A0A6J5VWH3_PRUAR|nr:unnamed protein product [Prunus armeniaca]
MDSKSSILREPQVKIKTKERPSNFNKSTRRLPSAFELVESDCNRNSRTLSNGVVYMKPPPKKRKKQAPPLTVNRDTHSSALEIVNAETTLPKKRPPKLPVHKQQIVNLEDLTQQYNDKLLVAIRPFIMGAKDVKSNGNCGFRAIARLLGYRENSWRKLHLQPHHPMPPIINCWLDISNLKALDWYSPYRDRIDNWKELIGSFDVHLDVY